MRFIATKRTIVSGLWIVNIFILFFDSYNLYFPNLELNLTSQLGQSYLVVRDIWK